MVDRYTLPPSMGGHECESTPGSLISEVMGGTTSVNYTVDGRTVTSVVPRSWLTPVKPPLPKRPEPPIGSYFRYGDLCWYHYPGGWIPVGGHERPVRQWAWLVEGYLDRWPDACEIAVPDPFAEPVQLPWRGSRFAVSVAKGLPRPVQIDMLVESDTDWCNADEARDLARAVWAAANQADKDGTP